MRKGKTTRNVKNITVAVSPELYHQTRMLAAFHQTTVTAMVAFLLERMPRLLKASRYPGLNPSPSALPATLPPERNAVSSCMPVNTP